MENKESVPQEGEFKMKKRPKKLSNDKVKANKIDLSKTLESKKEEPIKIDLDKDDTKPIKEVVEPVKEIVEEKEEIVNQKEVKSPIVEVTEDEPIEEKKEEIKKPVIKEEPKVELPENVDKLVNFMKDTGGTVEDYVRLNADYSNVDDVSLLKEFYKQSKPHLNNEEVDFLLDDQFSYDEEEDDEKTVRKRKLAIKEEVAKARGFLEETKSKYYDEIKLRPGITQEQQKATEFFNRYNSEQDKVNKTREDFIDRSTKYFNEDFKGFDFKLGDKKVKYQVSNPTELAKDQNDIANFLKKFLNEEGAITDLSKYHKSLFAAQNIDTIANHFYEQGKADAVKTEYAKSKNISNEPRVSPSSDAVYLNGLKIKAVSGANSAKLKIRKNKNSI
jgi:hypothetical protein|tara:strand:+ start:816 stop:1979 length:1164 start_codon:yes stop_codon:yes gene_type:complete